MNNQPDDAVIALPMTGRRKAARWFIVEQIFRLYRLFGLSTGEIIDHLYIRRIEWRALEQYLALDGSEKVCDVACGAGNWSRRLWRKSAMVVGIDLDLHALKWSVTQDIREHPTFAQGNAQELPLASSSFDRIVCVSSLEHFEDDRAALREMARVLKPGGIAVLTMDSLSHPSGLGGTQLADYKARHFIRRCYATDQIKQLAAVCGLETDEVRYLVNSWLSNRLHRVWAAWNLRDENSHRIEILFPLVYPLALISDRLFGNPDRGAVLAIKLRKREAVA
ncbi:MAG: class I SAM-dependent methyltransferase [Anaerolineae bacterium]